MRTISLAVLLIAVGCSRREHAATRRRPPGPRDFGRFAAQVERDTGAATVFATSRGGFRSVRVDGRVASPCGGARPIVQRYGPVDSAVVVRVSQFVPPFCEPGRYGFSFTAVAEGVAPGRIPVEVTWSVQTADPRGRSLARTLLRDTVAVLP